MLNIDPDNQGRDQQLCEALVDGGRLSPAAVDRVRALQHTTEDRLPALLAKLGFVSERDLAAALAELHGCRLVTAADFPVSPLFDGQLSPRFLREARVLPIDVDGARVHLAMADPAGGYASRAIGLILERDVQPCVATPTELDQAIDRLYGNQDFSGGVADTAVSEDDGVDTDIERLKDLASEAPVIRLVNRLITDAVERQASDIHLEPLEGALRLRYRLDGMLFDVDPPPARLRAAIVSRIKIMAKLNIAERRLPQDGRIKLIVRGTPVDLRVSTLPTLHGESVVLRILNREGVQLDYAALGIDGRNLEVLADAVDRPNGIFLVTGPTGSGKTTTLYAALSRLNASNRKIITVEDPVEYQLDGINQLQVKPGIGLDFAGALRSILRQDPDVILVGEIRDGETAQIATQAALTGHLVLSTLHTNSAAASVTRLLDMGVEDYLVTATLNGISAQRLVRRLCPECREPNEIAPDLAEHLGLARDGPPPGMVLYRAGGCAACNGSGYRGRSAILETLLLDDELRRTILKGADARQLHQAAVAAGMRTLYDDGLAKAVAGVTSLEEVLRVTRDA